MSSVSLRFAIGDRAGQLTNLQQLTWLQTEEMLVGRVSSSPDGTCCISLSIWLVEMKQHFQLLPVGCAAHHVKRFTLRHVSIYVNGYITFIVQVFCFLYMHLDDKKQCKRQSLVHHLHSHSFLWQRLSDRDWSLIVESCLVPSWLNW